MSLANKARMATRVRRQAEIVEAVTKYQLLSVIIADKISNNLDLETFPDMYKYWRKRAAKLMEATA